MNSANFHDIIKLTMSKIHTGVLGHTHEKFYSRILSIEQMDYKDHMHKSEIILYSNTRKDLLLEGAE